jgi:hypothetical protein
MRALFDYRSSQNATPQRASETGAANKSPRAKLPQLAAHPRVPRNFTIREEPFAPIALCIIIIDILLLARDFHRATADAKRRVQSALTTGLRAASIQCSSWRAPSVGKTQPRLGFRQELGDLIFIIRLIIVPEKRTVKSIHQAILLRATPTRKRHQGFVLRIAAFAYLCLLAPRLALAEAPEVVTPIELFDPNSGEGVRVAPSFVLYPQANLDLTYDSNVYNVEAQRMADGFVSVTPAFALKSDFSRHAVSLEGGAEIRRYFNTSDENSEQYRLNALSLLELGDGIDVEANLGYSRGIERRGTAGDVFFTDEPVVFDEKRVGVEISRTGRRLEIAVAGSLARRDYSDTTSGGIPVDLSFRDVTLKAAKIRADFGLNAKTKVFGELSGNGIDYHTATIPSRDSNGLAALVGVSHELTALVDVEVGIGFIQQDFKDASAKSVAEINYRLAASWTPAPQWRLTASATRFVDPSRSQEAPAIIASEFKIGVQRAIRDRLLLGAEAGYLDESYRASPRKDKRFFVSGTTTYRLADKIGVVVSAGYRRQDGGSFGRSYKGFAGTIGVRATW